jgi:hypothetical protein
MKIKQKKHQLKEFELIYKTLNDGEDECDSTSYFLYLLSCEYFNEVDIYMIWMMKLLKIIDL